MINNQLQNQAQFYDAGYVDKRNLEVGIPDFKITDGEVVSGKKILNIGGGNSADLWYLSGQNEIHAVDCSIEGVDQAKQHGINAVSADVSLTLPYDNANFDVVILKDILEHVYNSFEVFMEAKRVCKDSGYIILSLPNHFYLPFRLRLLFGDNLIWKSLFHNQKNDFEEWNYQHIRFFTWRGVKKMIEAADLKIDKTYWDFGTLAHYNDPVMFENAFKLNNKKIINRRQFILYRILLPLFKIFNVIFPMKLRGKIVSLSPGLLCAGFYLRLRKKI